MTSLIVSSQSARIVELPSRTALARARKGALAFEIIAGEEACDWSARGVGRATWLKLADECPWSTVFQSPGFFDVWCHHYAKAWSPLLLLARRLDNTVVGLMPLAAQRGLITGAGAHQAEYHGWISAESDAKTFLTGALATLAEAMPGHALRLRYLPPAAPASILGALEKANPRLEVFRHVAHEFALDRQKIADALKKKSNKSKLNRLARLGPLSVRKLDADTLAPHLDRVIAMYDFRQGARNGVYPFLDDHEKRAFHLDWIKSHPDQMHATGMFLGERMISALLLAMSKNDAHLAIAAHDPTFAEHSPSKLHIYEAAAMLADEGRRVLDFTPGDDAWKERFSTGRRQILELVMHPSLQRASAARARRAAKDFAKRTLQRVGLSRQIVMSKLHAATHAARKAIATTRTTPRAQLYRIDLSAVALARDTSAARNDLDALLRWGASLTGQRRQPFLQQALERVESGDRCYTLRTADGLAALAWLSVRPGTDRAKPTRVLADFALAPGPASQQAANLAAIVACAWNDAGDGTERQLLATAAPRDTLVRDALVAAGFRPLTPSL